MPALPRSAQRRKTAHVALMSLRINAGLSRADLALRAGIGRETLRLAESGFVPTPRVQFAIAHALGSTPLELWPIEVQPRPRVAA
jgi:lambda repressor-like predicted transcriptional regulator